MKTPVTTEPSDSEIVKRNETDDEKLKKSIAAAAKIVVQSKIVENPNSVSKPVETLKIQGDSKSPNENVKTETNSEKPGKISPVDEKTEKELKELNWSKTEPTGTGSTNSPVRTVKSVNPSPLPIKKRRYHAIMADVLNHSVQSDATSSTASSRNISPVNQPINQSASSSDSDLPLAIIRQKLQKPKNCDHVIKLETPPTSQSESPPLDTIGNGFTGCRLPPKIRMRKEDFISDMESSLRTFKQTVVTPSMTSSSSESEVEQPKKKVSKFLKSGAYK